MRHPCERVARLIAWLALLLGPAPAAASNRLGHQVLPRSESIRLEIDPRKRTYAGSVHVELAVAAATDSFRFHAEEIKLRRVALRGPTGAVPLSLAPGRLGLVTAHAATPLAAGAYTLDISFSNDFNTKATSLYRLDTGGRSYAFTQFESVEARAAFPCWDEPEFKIPYQLTLVVPTANLAVSNTPIEAETVVGGEKTVVFERTPPLPSYLLAIAVGPLESVPIPGMSVPGRVIGVQGTTPLMQEAVRTVPPLLAALERYFGRPYPYRKLDLIAVPEFWYGAMENPGAIVFTDRALLFDPHAVTASQRYTLATFAAHEMAHMWFGDLVTMRWWDDLWLNESFASWMGDKITGQVFPEFEMPVDELGGTQRAMLSDARATTRAMRRPVGDDVNLEQLADVLSYHKGQALLGMFEQWLTPEVFRRGVLAYLASHAHGSAEAADLWNALSKASGRDVAGPMKSFLDQAGMPLVKAEVLPGGRVRLRQQRFLNYGARALRTVRWKIPVTIAYGTGKETHTQTLLLARAEQIMVLDHPATRDWIDPNADQRGYYRWALPADLMQRLAESAPRRLDTRERVGLLDNAAALLDAGILRGDEYLELLARFGDDEAPQVVTSVIQGLDKIYEIVDRDERGAFAACTRAILRPALRRFGMTPAPGEREPVTRMRPELLWALADHGKDRAVLDQASRWARAYLRDPSAVHPSLVATALGLAALGGDVALFDDYRVRFEHAKTPADRSRFLAALGDFRDPKVVDRALAYSLTGPLRPQETNRIANSLRTEPELRDRTYRWMAENYAAIAARVPAFVLPDLVYFASGCSLERLERARAFFADSTHRVAGTGEEFEKMAERCRDCVRLKEREGASISRFLAQAAAEAP